MAAWFFTLNHIATKEFVKDTDPTYLSYAQILFLVVVSIPFTILLWHKFIFNWQFLLGSSIGGIITVIAQILYMKSLKFGSIGKTVPLLSISPIFTIPFAYLIIGELPGLIGISGIIIIIIGAYILNLESFTYKNFFLPFISIIKNKGSRFMFYVALFFAFGAVLDKFVITNTNIYTRIGFFAYFTIIPFTLYLIIKERKKFGRKTKEIIKQKYLGLFILIVITFVEVVMNVIALSLTFTAYFIALKRASALFSVIIAYFMFKERDYFLHHILGTILIIAGVILLVL